MNDLDQLLDNEREWRRYMIERIEEHRKEITHIKVWSMVFRLVGGALLSLLYIWVDHVLGSK
jgi:hypothetical protein